MANQIKTDFIFNLDDKNMVSRLSRIEQGVGGINKVLDSFGGKAVMLNQTFELLGKVSDGVRLVFETAKQGAANKDIATAFDTQMQKLGVSAESGLGRFRKAVNDTIDNVTLMQIANKGLISGLDPEMIATAMEYVTKYAKSAGGDAAQLLQTVLTGLTRGSTEFLDDVGIIVSQTEVVNRYTKEWGRSLTDAEKKQVILSEAMKQMNEKMVDFEGLADSQSEKLQKLITKWANFKNAMANAMASAVIPDEIKPYGGSKYQEYKHINSLLGGIRRGNISGYSENEIKKMTLRRNDLKRKLDWEKQNKIDTQLRGIGGQGAAYLAQVNTANALIDEQDVEARTAGLDSYRKKLVEIGDEYEAMRKAAKGDKGLLALAEEWKTKAEANAYKNLNKKDKQSAAEVKREAERTQREIDRKAEKLTEETEKNKTEIKIAELSDYGSEALAIENKLRVERLKARSELREDLHDAEKLGSAELKQLAHDKFDSRINLINAQRDAERKAFAERQAEAEQEIVWQSMLAEMELADQQKQSASSLRKQTWENRQSFQDRFSDEYTQKDNALKRDMWSKFTETNDWDATDQWYKQEKAALDYAAAIGQVDQRFTMLGGSVSNSDIKGAFDAMESSVAGFVTTFAQTGEVDLSGLVSGLTQTLQVYAAEKVAHLTMEYLFNQLMAFIHPENGNYAKSAALAAQGIPVFSGFVAGSALAGMAHDGIGYVPREGTWLLDKGERVVDSRTNSDLKEFLKNAGGGGVNVSLGGITINGGDEQGVLKAIPQLEKAVTDIVIKAVSGGNASLRNAIATYAR